MRAPLPAALAAFIAAVFTLQAAADGRLVYQAESPAWLGAVGKLRVPGSRYAGGRREYFTEDCSATLVNRSEQQRANIILTAWHCLEKYSDLSKPIRFTLTPAEGPAIETEAHVLADGGSIESDWAFLKLHRPISTRQVAALAVATGDIDTRRELLMAGYSRDAGLGAGGKHLTYDPACRVTGRSNQTTTTDCIAHKGASGGPVIQRDGNGRPTVYGVISEGNGDGVSIFVPTSAFRQAVRLHLRR